MRIIFHECKKAFSSPILIGLILLFAVFNIYLIFSNSYFKDELLVLNELAKTYGVNITDESLQKFEQDLHKEIVKLNEITEKHTTQEFTSVTQFLETLSYEDYSLYSEKEWAFLNNLQLKEMYLNLAKSIDSEYEKIDWEQIAQFEINKYQLSGRAAETIKNENMKLAQRFENLKENGEHKQWFFAGNPYRMHSFLFRTIFGYLIFEALILTVLATALITNFEFENRTHFVTYSTKRGRDLAKDKLKACLLVTTSMITFLLTITLSTYFSVFDYSYLWESSISSALNWEYIVPYVSWWDLSFLSFLLWSIVLVYVSLLLFSTITFVVSLFLKNSYFTFFIFSAIFTILLMMPKFVPTSSILILITGFNLSTLVMNPHMFFMGNSGLVMFKYYEIITISVWTMISISLCIYSVKKFKKREIH